MHFEPSPLLSRVSTRFFGSTDTVRGPARAISLFPDRPTPTLADLPVLRRDRPTRRAAEFLDAIVYEMPDGGIRQIKADIQRAAESLRRQATVRAIFDNLSRS
jgi:hypothetical protein